MAYYIHNGLIAASSAFATMVAYLDYLFESGTVRGGFIRPYFAASAAKPGTLGLRDSTADGQVALMHREYCTRIARRAIGPPHRSAPLSDAVSAHALSVALASSSYGKLRCFRLLALTFLLCSQRGSTRELQRQDLDFTSSPGAAGSKCGATSMPRLASSLALLLACPVKNSKTLSGCYCIASQTLLPHRDTSFPAAAALVSSFSPL